MPEREILIHLRRCDASSRSVLLGLRLAARLKAYAFGLHVVPIAPAAFASPEAVALHVREADDLYRDALACSGWWQTTLAAAGLSGEWQVAQGDTVEALCHAARWCDLVVAERPTLQPDAPTGWGIVSRTVFGASTPVVVIPETVRGEDCGERIVVAWNASREGTLAIRGALPLLAQASAVTVLEGVPHENPFGLRYLPKLDLRAYLARHGVNATFEPFAATKDAASALLDAARARNADLIVMGAWGHSRIAELVIGGTTRQLFQTSDIPLFVAH